VGLVFRTLFHKEATQQQLVGVARLERLAQGWREYALARAIGMK
jgi:hypothetical protein